MCEQIKKWNWNVVFSIIAIGISVASLCMVYLRIEPVKFDSLGVFAGILSFMIAIVISFQIYNVFNVKNELDKFEKRLNTGIKENEDKINNSNEEIRKQIEELKNKINYNFNSLAFHLYNNLSIQHTPDKGNIFYCLYYSLMCLIYIKRQGDNFEKDKEKAHLEKIDKTHKRLLAQGGNIGENKNLLYEIIIINELHKKYNAVDSLRKEILSK